MEHPLHVPVQRSHDPDAREHGRAARISRQDWGEHRGLWAKARKSAVGGEADRNLKNEGDQHGEEEESNPYSVAKESLFYVRLGMSGVLIPVGLFLRDRSGIDADDHHATLHGVVFDILVRRTCFILRSRRGCATHSPRAKRGGPAWTRTRTRPL
jgi:hypothetical protein